MPSHLVWLQEGRLHPKLAKPSSACQTEFST